MIAVILTIGIGLAAAALVLGVGAAMLGEWLGGGL